MLLSVGDIPGVTGVDCDLSCPFDGESDTESDIGTVAVAG